MNCKEKNTKRCNCTYNCSYKGICCDCIANHRAKKQLPACYFPPEAERKYDRSIDHYIKLLKEGKLL